MIDRIVARVNDDVITLSELQRKDSHSSNVYGQITLARNLSPRSSVPNVSSLIS